MISIRVLASIGAITSDARSGALNANTGRLVIMVNGMIVTVGRSVGVGVTVAVDVLVAVGVVVWVGVGVAVELAVAVGVGVNVGVAVKVGDGDGSPKATGIKARVN